MGIRLASLEEGCCEYLNSINTLDLDKHKEDKTMSSVDRVLECKKQYLFIEEKSFILDYFRLCGDRKRNKFIPKDGLIEDDFLEQISTLPKETKRELLYKALFGKTLSSSDKIKDTTYMLTVDDKFDNEKIKNANTIYLYCKSNDTQLDRLMSLTFNSKKQKNKIISCDNLEKYLKNKGCI